MSPSSDVVGVVCALAAEARTLDREARRDAIHRRTDGTLICVSGMGAAAAIRGSNALIEAGARALVSWGMVGGLDPALRAGTLLLPGRVIGPDGGFDTATDWRERLGAALGAGEAIVHGTLYTSPRAIDSVAAKAALFHKTAAVAVDMESLHVAAVADARRLPFVAVKVIVDGAFDALPAAIAAAAGAEQLQPARLAWALARSPRELPPLLRLALRYRRAKQSLAAAARIGLLTPARATAGASAGDAATARS